MINILDIYFSWLCAVIAPNHDVVYLSEYSQLLNTLNSIEFKADNNMDDNRRIDGLDLRLRFFEEQNLQQYADVMNNIPCSLLEMMVALALKCEETIMVDNTKGDRTYVWFNEMIISLQLNGQTNSSFDYNYVIERITILYNKNYDYYGHGSLFTALRTDQDMRTLSIWYQMNQFLLEYDDGNIQNYDYN